MPKHLNTEEAALYVALSASQLTKMRHFKIGPAHLKLGRAVRYAVADLDAWLQGQRRPTLHAA